MQWPTRFAVLAIIGCAAATAAGGQAGVRPGYVLVGEGLSSAAPGADAEFDSRMFTIYILDEACRGSRAGEVVGLRAQRSRLTLHVGEPFSPGSLKVAALNAAGALLPKVPVVVEVKSPTDAFDARYPWGESGQLRASGLLIDGALMPLHPAQVSFRFRTICPGAAAEMLVDADIRRR